MTEQEIISLFPLEVQVTQEIIDVADVNNSADCIGARTLQSVIKLDNEDDVIYWGRTDGKILLHTNHVIAKRIVVESDRDMMRITEPCTVTFTLR